MYLQAVGSLGGGEKNAFLLDLVPKILLWGLIEVDLAIVAACLPTFAPLLQDRTLQSVVRSARSAVSLHSRESGNRLERDNKENSQAKRSWLMIQASNRSGTLAYHADTAEVSTDGGDARQDIELGIRVDRKFDVAGS